MVAPNVQLLMDAIAAQNSAIGQAVVAMGGLKTKIGDMQAQMDAMAQQILSLAAAPQAIDPENAAAVDQMTAAVAANTDSLKAALV